MGRSELAKYFPRDKEVQIVDELLEVVNRLEEVLPRDKILRMYTSGASETGGVPTFPYCRVDSMLMVARMRIDLVRTAKTTEEMDEHYTIANEAAMETLVWVEIGFQGLANFAKSRASINWTSGVGHIVTPSQREAGIMSGGKQMYDSAIGEFVSARDNWGIPDNDCFTKYNLNYLLDNFRA